MYATAGRMAMRYGPSLARKYIIPMANRFTQRFAYNTGRAIRNAAIKYGSRAGAIGLGAAADSALAAYKRRGSSGSSRGYNKSRRLSDSDFVPETPPASSVTRRRRRAKYNTTGRMGPRFPKGTKKVPPYKMLKKGSMSHTERGGIYEVAIGNTLYIGHNFEVQDIVRAQMRALLMVLFNKAGIMIGNWDNKINTDLRFNTSFAGNPVFAFTVEYQNNQGILTNNSILQIPFNVNSTVNNAGSGEYSGLTVWGAQQYSYRDLAELLYLQWYGILKSTAGPQQNLRLMKIHLHMSTAAVPMASLTLENSRFVHQLKSRLKLLNRTLAGTTAVGDADADQADDIAANPLQGNVYDSPNDRSNFQLNQGQRGLSLTSSEWLSGPRIITANSANLPPCLRKPPKAFVLSCQKSAKVALAPGEIRTSYINYSKSIGINEFISRFRKCLIVPDGSTNYVDFEFGKASLFGLECTLNTRTSEATNISVGYELEQDINVMFVEVNRIPAPIVEVFT